MRWYFESKAIGFDRDIDDILRECASAIEYFLSARARYEESMRQANHPVKRTAEFILRWIAL